MSNNNKPGPNSKKNREKMHKLVDEQIDAIEKAYPDSEIYDACVIVEVLRDKNKDNLALAEYRVRSNTTRHATLGLIEEAKNTYAYVQRAKTYEQT